MTGTGNDWSQCQEIPENFEGCQNQVNATKPRGVSMPMTLVTSWKINSTII